MSAKNSVLCVHCRRPVRMVTRYGEGGTTWTHWDGYDECRPTYAAPDLISYERAKQEQS